MATKKAPATKTKTKTAPKKKTTAKKRTLKPRATLATTPTPDALAQALGVTLAKPLTPAQIRAFVKAPPGYVNWLDDAADQYDKDADTLRVKDVSADRLRALKAQQKDLAKREAVAYAVYRSVYEQRLAVDSEAMKALQAIARRISAMKGDHPDLSIDWKSVLDSLAQFHPGRPAKDPAPADTAG